MEWRPEGWAPEGWAPEGWGPEGWAPEGWRPLRVGAQKVGGSNLEKVGCPKGGGPKFRVFLSSPTSNFDIFSSLGVFSCVVAPGRGHGPPYLSIWASLGSLFFLLFFVFFFFVFMSYFGHDLLWPQGSGPHLLLAPESTVVKSAEHEFCSSSKSGSGGGVAMLSAESKVEAALGLWKNKGVTRKSLFPARFLGSSPVKVVG